MAYRSDYGNHIQKPDSDAVPTQYFIPISEPVTLKNVFETSAAVFDRRKNFDGKSDYITPMRVFRSHATVTDAAIATEFPFGPRTCGDAG